MNVDERGESEFSVEVYREIAITYQDSIHPRWSSHLVHLTWNIKSGQVSNEQFISIQLSSFHFKHNTQHHHRPPPIHFSIYHMLHAPHVHPRLNQTKPSNVIIARARKCLLSPCPVLSCPVLPCPVLPNSNRLGKLGEYISPNSKSKSKYGLWQWELWR